MNAPAADSLVFNFADCCFRASIASVSGSQSSFRPAAAADAAAAEANNWTVDDAAL